ncbi:MAG: PH domain-containing protein [Thermoguttaceae bacterium]|nr:PH domain-containing protein [Thermoguttaceae bacterium]
MTKTNASAPVSPPGPWREGRPSFKAFYPEIVFLTIVTIGFIALAARLSCSGTKPKSENAAPTPVSSATLFSTPQAFAQDASLDAPLATEETPASQADENVNAPVDDLEPVEAVAPEAASVASTPSETETTPVASTPNETKTENAASQATKSGASVKILAIWGVCLAIPAFLWVWRAWNWIVAVYGVKFEIRCDADNPKATTILVTRGIFNKKTDSLHIAQVKDIQSSQTFFQKYFQGGVGTISLFTQDLTDGILTMKNMEEPSRVFNALDELRRRYWALGGVGGLNGQANAGEMENIEGVNEAM